MGAHDYIHRPIDGNELLARVRTQIRRKRFQERLRSTYEISLSMALTDSLTGLYNRRYFETHLQKLLQKSEESKKTLGVLLMDIDHFKSFNDTYGHGVGDDVLKIFAERVKDSLRSFDLVARLGGEEFVVILPDVSEDMAHVIAERLRRTIGDVPFVVNAPEGQVTVTTSIGGALIDTVDRTELVLERADKALYEAKEGGRNRTVFEGVGTLDPIKYQRAARQFME